MLEDVFREHLWPGLVCWIVLYISDYALTVVSARVYRARAAAHIVFEGSYELTPQFQGDIDRLRIVSPRFVLMLFVTSSLLSLMWWLVHETSMSDAAYLVALGAMILTEAVVHLRHCRNLHMFSTGFASGGVRGRIEYSRPVMLRASAFELLEFSVFFAFLFLVTGNWLFAGGALACVSQGMKHRQWIRDWNESRRTGQPAETVTPAEV
jgi:hypothetical protein